ncbi:MAG: chromate efflux transporter [Arenicellales bacterium]
MLATATEETSLEQNHAPTLAQATRIWTKIGLMSFGGPAAQIALMHRILVDDKRWLNEKTYLNALSFCMLLPGPEAMQLATYAGWRLHGTLGGLIAGLLFVLPGAVVVLVFSIVYAMLGDVPLVNTLFLGIKATVLVIVLEALLRVAKRTMKSAIYWAIAMFAFVGIFFMSLPYPLIVLGAAAIGFFLNAAPADTSIEIDQTHRSLSRLARTVLIWLAIWALPILVIDFFFSQQLLLEISLFFSRLAVVTFGGAYAVLAYMGQAAVSDYGWLSAGEMMDGLGLAETTPGPLILVTEFVGFIAAFREGGIGLGLAGAAVTLWTTFVPCFLWIFAGAPHIEWICHQPRLNGALTAISAAVVGVILNLSIWFALHVVFKSVSVEKYGIFTVWQPDLFSIDFRVVVLTTLSAAMIFKLHWSISRVLLISSICAVLLVSVAGYI